jgi:hypothetical protein
MCIQCMREKDESASYDTLVCADCGAKWHYKRQTGWCREHNCTAWEPVCHACHERDMASEYDWEDDYS